MNKIKLETQLDLEQFEKFTDFLSWLKTDRLKKKGLKVIDEGTMDIYSQKGTKVIFTGKNGYDSQLEYANKYLEIGKEYTVKSTEVGEFSSTVQLEEFPTNYFNTVHFTKSKD